MINKSHFTKPKMRLRELILTVTNRCNHACKMCYYHSLINRNIRLLTYREFERVCKSLGRIDLLMITGGEPFLRKDLLHTLEPFYKYNYTRSLFLPTNGSSSRIAASMVSNILEKLPKINLNIMLSLEGLKDTHDYIHGKRGAFNSVLETADKLNTLRFRFLKKKRFFGITLNTVITNKNIDEAIPLMEYVNKNMWVDFHTLSPMRGTGRHPGYRPPSGKSFDRLFRDARPYLEFYASRKTIPRQRQRKSIKWFVNRYRLWIDILNGERLPFLCPAGNRIGVLEPNGDVRLCELTEAVGNVRDSQYDFRRVWFSKKAFAIRRKIVDCTCTHGCFLNAGERQN